MSSFQQSFSQYLRNARQSASLTQAEMAEKLSVSRSTYTYYETGHAQPDLESLAKICRILGISADSLLGLG